MNSLRERSMSDTALFSFARGHSELAALVCCSAGPVPVVDASLSLLELEILAAIRTSGRLSSRIAFSNFCFSLSAFFNALASRFSFLRDSLSDGVNGVRLYCCC